MANIDEEKGASPAANEAAKKSMADEKAKFGFNRPAARASSSNSEDTDEAEDLDSDEEEEVETSEEEEEETDDSESEEEAEESDEDSEEESEEEDNSSSKKAKIPFKKYNELRKELGDANRKLAEMQNKMPDDFQARVDTLTKELGVTDPEMLKKVINFVKEFGVDKNTKVLEEKIAKLEKDFADKNKTSVVDEFPSEWVSFESKIKKEYPNATPEQLKTVQKRMRELAGTKDIGGMEYIHPETKKKVLNPYPLDYIFYNHRDEFDELVTKKKTSSMERARGGKMSASRDDSNDDLHVPRGASADTIRSIDKKYRELEAKASDRFSSNGQSI